MNTFNVITSCVCKKVFSIGLREMKNNKSTDISNNNTTMVVSCTVENITKKDRRMDELYNYTLVLLYNLGDTKKEDNTGSVWRLVYTRLVNKSTKIQKK